MNKEELAARFFELRQKLNIDEKKTQASQLLAESSDSGFWFDSERASKKMKRLGSLQKEIDRFEELELLLEEDELTKIEVALNELESMAFLSGPYDSNEAIFSVHAGQGGTEAMDWAAMLERMYLRYFDRKNYQYSRVDCTPGEEVGIKSVTYQVSGDRVYGYLKGEFGVHRLVRLSPFNANNLRQTSFALVEVIPLIEEANSIELKDEEIEFQATHSSGHGGQNINKVATAVRLKHIPSGIVVNCQMERSQARNREIAMRLLKSKLMVLEEGRQRQKKQEIKGEHKTPGWGRQIRSYVLQPYKLVKDLRTGVESSNPDAVLDGDLDDFIRAQLRAS